MDVLVAAHHVTEAVRCRFEVLLEDRELIERQRDYSLAEDLRPALCLGEHPRKELHERSQPVEVRLGWEEDVVNRNLEVVHLLLHRNNDPLKLVLYVHEKRDGDVEVGDWVRWKDTRSRVCLRALICVRWENGRTPVPIHGVILFEASQLLRGLHGVCAGSDSE